MDRVIQLLRERETIANHEASNYRRAIQCLENAFLQGPVEPPSPDPGPGWKRGEPGEAEVPYWAVEGGK